MSSLRGLSGNISGRDTVVGTIKVDQGSIPKGKVKTLDEYVSALKAGVPKTSAERGDKNVITADTIASVDGITKVPIENIDSIDEENCYFYKIEELYLTKAYLITSDNQMNVKEKIKYYLTKTSIPVLQVVKTGTMGGRKSRRSRKSKKSRKHRKGKSRRSRQ